MQNLNFLRKAFIFCLILLISTNLISSEAGNQTVPSELNSELNPFNPRQYNHEQRYEFNTSLIRRMLAVYHLNVYEYFSNGLNDPANDFNFNVHIPQQAANGNSEQPNQIVNLEQKYDTPLKRKLFEKSTDYKNKLNHLKKLRELLFQKEFYINIGITIHDVTVRTDTDISSIVFKSHYNLNKQRYELFFHKHQCNSVLIEPVNRIPLKTYLIENVSTHYGFILDFPFEVIKVKSIVSYYALVFVYYFNVNEETALSIENESKTRIYFKFSGVKVYKKQQGDYGDKVICFTTRSNRIEILSKSGQVLYKKQY